VRQQLWVSVVGKKRAPIREGDRARSPGFAETQQTKSFEFFPTVPFPAVNVTAGTGRKKGVAEEISGCNRPDPHALDVGWGLKRSGRDTDRALSCSS
jgi:hypothetical protein